MPHTKFYVSRNSWEDRFSELRAFIENRTPWHFPVMQSARQFSTLVDSKCMFDAQNWASPKNIEIIQDGLAMVKGADSLESSFKSGRTFIVNGYNHAPFEGIRSFVHNVCGILRMPVKINAFMTPKGHTAFPWHFDGRDVLILQVEGTKRWDFAKEIVDSPLNGEEVRQPLEFETVSLKEGDMFFLPAGRPHRVSAEKENSLHLTVNLLPVRRLELIQEQISVAAAEDVRLRQACTYENLLGYEEAKSMIAEHSHYDLQSCLQKLTHRWVCDLPQLGGISKRKAVELEPDSVIGRSPGLLCFVTTHEEHVKLSIGGIGRIRDDPGIVRLTKRDYIILDFLLNLDDDIVLAELGNRFGDAGRELAMDLISCGVLRIYSPSTVQQKAMATASASCTS